MKSIYRFACVLIVLCVILVWPLQAAICEYYQYRAMTYLFVSKPNLEQARFYHRKARFFGPLSHWKLYEIESLIHLYSMNQLSAEQSYKAGLESIKAGQKRNPIFYKFDYLEAQLHNQMYIRTNDSQLLVLVENSLKSALLKNPRNLSSRYMLADHYERVGQRNDALSVLWDGINIMKIFNVYDISYLNKLLQLEKDLKNKKKLPIIQKRIQWLQMKHHNSKG